MEQEDISSHQRNLSKGDMIAILISLFGKGAGLLFIRGRIKGERTKCDKEYEEK